MEKSHLCSLLLLLPLSTISALGSGGARVGPSLVESRKILISGQISSAQQIVDLGTGGLLARTAEPSKLSEQAITLLSRDGRALRKIGSFGETPGTYYVLKQLAVSKLGKIWVLDMRHRVTRFDMSGQVQSTNLLQSPGYVAHAIALDEDRGLYYVAGCAPIKHYVDLGCLWIHQYDIHSNGFKKSFLQTEDLAVKNHYLSLEDYSIDVSPSDGSVFIVDPPIRKFWKLDPGTGNIQAFPLGARDAPDIPALDPTKSPDVSEYCLAQRIFVLRDYVVISVRRPGPARYVLEVFDLNGRQVAVDLSTPGTPLGKTEDQRGIWFSKGDNTKPDHSFELIEGVLK